LREFARERFPDDELTAEITAREAFDAEETAAYAADLDAQVKEEGVLEAARAATRLREELHEELRAEGSGGNNNDGEYVHLDDDDLDADRLTELDLPTDEEIGEAAAEQRALMALFEM
jgi:hypothetical protein